MKCDNPDCDKTFSSNKDMYRMSLYLPGSLHSRTYEFCSVKCMKSLKKILNPPKCGECGRTIPYV